MLSSHSKCTSTRVALMLAIFMVLNIGVAILVITQIPREIHTSINQSISQSVNQHTIDRFEKIGAGLDKLIDTPLIRSTKVINQSCPRVVDGVDVQALRQQIHSALTQIRTLEASITQATGQPTNQPSSQIANQPVNNLIHQPINQLSYKPWLIIGIPTVGRPNPKSSWYLNATLHSIADQLTEDVTDPMYGQVHVVVMNNAAPEQGEHVMFETCRKALMHRPEFHFMVNSGNLVDATPADRDAGTPDFPGWKVRKQTRDIAATLEPALGKSHYYMFMEDDFTWCPHLLLQLRQMIHKANRLTKIMTFPPVKPLDSPSSPSDRKDFFSLKMSFGMNGYVIHNDADSQHLYEYLLRKQRIRPPDHLMVEWSAGERESASYKRYRPHFVYRYNLLEHLGTISSLRDAVSPDYPPCWHTLNTEVVFEVESFNAKTCSHDDMSPCANPTTVASLVDEQARTQYIPKPFHISDAEIGGANKK